MITRWERSFNVKNVSNIKLQLPRRISPMVNHNLGGILRPFNFILFSKKLRSWHFRGRKVKLFSCWLLKGFPIIWRDGIFETVFYHLVYLDDFLVEIISLGLEIYFLQCCVMYPEDIIRVDRIIFKFLWNKKWDGKCPDRIQRQVLKNSYDDTTAHLKQR